MAAKVRLLITLLTHAGMAAPSCRLSYVWDVAPPVPGAGMRDNGPYVKPTVSTPFAGATLYRVDGIAVLQITNLTLSAGVIRTAGKLPVKPALKAVGALSYNNAAGYVAVSTDGTTTCWSTASGDFSGQVFFAIQD